MKTANLIFSIFLLLLLGACATTEETLDGQALFISKSCSGCHGSDASGIVGNGIDIRGKTASRISYALNGGVSQMSGLPSLTSAEIDAIAEYLLSLSSSSKLSKASAVINGVIQSDQDTTAIVVLKDNSGQVVELEIENGEFAFDSDSLQFPVLLKYADEEESVLFGLSDGQGQGIKISSATDEMIQQYVDAEKLFEACNEMSDGCFDVLDDEEVIDAVQAVAN